LAIHSARKALPEWKRTSVSDRIKIVEKFATWLEGEYGEEGEQTRLKTLIHDEIGKPFPEADIEVIESADFVRYFCAEAEKELSPKAITLDTGLWPSKRSTQLIDPIGVVGVIKPWNYPLELIIWSIIPALLTGNTIVIKPSEKSSLVGLEIAKIAEFSGIPSGVINVVTGDSTTGKALVEHNDIDMISFTGSEIAGKNVAVSCAKNLTKCTLELGGNDYAIVTADADIELVANGLTWGAFTNAGQVCVGIKQVLVDKEIAEEVIEAIVIRTNQLILEQDISPLVDRFQLEIAESFIEDAKSKGAVFLTGGTRSKDHKGYFMLPSVITNLSNDMQLVQEECFAPLMPIRVVSSLDEAIGIVNSSKYGLGASVWTKKKGTAEKVANQLNVGMIWHNDVNIAFPSAPWGGKKSSGIGSELSSSAFEEYGCKKHICIENESEKSRDWWYPYG
jgi:acyl-CoA reductase-like NAD-dependent aldehyde dehydrogenase